MNKNELRRVYDDAARRLENWRKDGVSEDTLGRLERERDRAFQAMFQAGA